MTVAALSAENRIADLEEQVNSLQRTLDTLLQNGLNPLLITPGTLRFGGNTMQLDHHGVQIATDGTDTVAVHFAENFHPDPAAITPNAKILGNVDEAGDEAFIQTLVRSTGAYTATSSVSTGAADSSSKLESTEVSSGRAASVFTYIDSTQATTYINASLGLGTAFGTNPSILSPAQITGNQNDYSPTDWVDSGLILRLDTDASRDITGLAGGREGRTALIFNVGSFDIVLKDEDAGSSAANRFALNGDVTIEADEGALLWHDSTSTRWRMAAKYAAGGGAGDVATDSIWNALGDLAVGTGPNTASILTVGTDDSILMADSGTASGLKWAGAATTAEIADVTTGVEAAGTSDTYARGDHVHHGDFAPSTVDYLVGTATGDLSAEIVVGTSPGGELGGTWASPTVDATHSGSAHADYIAKSLVDAKGDILTATADNTPARLAVGMDGYVLTADALESTGIKWAAATGSGDVATDTIWDAIGDLAVGSGANTASVLTVGPDDYVLTADSGEPLGVKWAPAAGGSGDTTSIARTLLLVGA